MQRSMRHKLNLLSVTLIGLASANSQAMDVAAAFSELDKDSNGTLSEAEASEDAVLHENFAQIDKNQDGQISMAEFKAFLK